MRSAYNLNVEFTHLDDVRQGVIHENVEPPPSPQQAFDESQRRFCFRVQPAVPGGTLNPVEILQARLGGGQMREELQFRTPKPSGTASAPVCQQAAMRTQG